MAFVFLGLSYLSQSDGFLLHPLTWKFPSFIFQISWIIWNCVNVLDSSHDGHPGCFQHLAIVSGAAMDKDEQPPL